MLQRNSAIMYPLFGFWLILSLEALGALICQNCKQELASSILYKVFCWTLFVGIVVLALHFALILLDLQLKTAGTISP